MTYQSAQFPGRVFTIKETFVNIIGEARVILTDDSGSTVHFSAQDFESQFVPLLPSSTPKCDCGGYVTYRNMDPIYHASYCSTRPIA